MTEPARLAAYRLGLRAEWAAAWLLRLKGFGIVARRVKTPAGEIDLVARRGRLLVFAEVKARPMLDNAAWAITEPQRARILRAAQAFAARQPKLAGCDWRFDAILVAPGRWPRHISDAFRPGLK